MTVTTELKHIRAMHASDKGGDAVLSMAGDKLATLIDGNSYSAGKVNNLAKSLAKRGKVYDADVHAAAVAAIYISMPPADGGTLNGEPARQLISSIAKVSRAKTLADWFSAFSNVRLRFDDKAKAWSVKLVKPGAVDYKEAMPLKAFDQPFWSVPETTRGAAAFDLAKGIAQIIARAETARKNNNLTAEEDSKVNALSRWARNQKLLDADNNPLKHAA